MVISAVMEIWTVLRLDEENMIIRDEILERYIRLYSLTDRIRNVDVRKEYEK